MASVHLRNVTVNFPIYDARSRSLKRRAMSLVTGGRVRSDPTGRISTDASHRVLIRALDRVDLTIEHGTRIGLIGRNGAGKSTLLHVLAGIYAPESGTVAVDGKIASLFGGSLGVDPELSGRENIELRGLYLGLSKKETTAAHPIRSCGGRSATSSSGWPSAPTMSSSPTNSCKTGPRTPAPIT